MPPGDVEGFRRMSGRQRIDGVMLEERGADGFAGLGALGLVLARIVDAVFLLAAGALHVANSVGGGDAKNLHGENSFRGSKCAHLFELS